MNRALIFVIIRISVVDITQTTLPGYNQADRASLGFSRWKINK